jgi:D-serine deaminase-like pyridoxal phosphate-dependent protein
MNPPPNLEAVATPALLVDGAVLNDNIVQMAARASAAGVELWPHSKTHKSRRIAALQHEHGASGLTTATLREAECFADAGFDNLLIAYPPVGHWRLDRLCSLAQRASLRVVLDSAETVAMLDDACRRNGCSIGYLWEVDCGVGRCGTQPGQATATLIERAVASFSHATFDGLMTFGGHAYAAADTDGIVGAADDEKNALAGTASALGALGINARARSAGTTPTSHQLTEAGPITEIRPGNYVFYDATQVTLGLVPEERCALSVLATVVSRPDPRRVILDCGSKALAAERLTTRTQTFGFVAGHPELAVERLFEEHAILTSSEPTEISLGSRLRVIPNHSCATANLHETMLVLEGDQVVDLWPVDARSWDHWEGSRAPSAVGAVEEVS